MMRHLLLCLRSKLVKVKDLEMRLEAKEKDKRSLVSSMKSWKQGSERPRSIT